jgi:hypothetical protein
MKQWLMVMIGCALFSASASAAPATITVYVVAQCWHVGPEQCTILEDKNTSAPLAEIRQWDGPPPILSAAECDRLKQSFDGPVPALNGIREWDIVCLKKTIPAWSQ